MNEIIDIPVEELAEDIRLNVVDIEDFNERVVGAYNEGTAEKGLEADDAVAPQRHSRRNRRISRLQLYRSRYSGIHHRKLRRLHGLRDGVPGYGNSRQSRRTLGTRGKVVQDRRSQNAQEHGRSSGQSPTSTSPFLKRRLLAPAGSSASSSIRQSARAAPSASMPAAITMP